MVGGGNTSGENFWITTPSSYFYSTVKKTIVHNKPRLRKFLVLLMWNT